MPTESSHWCLSTTFPSLDSVQFQMTPYWRRAHYFGRPLCTTVHRADHSAERHAHSTERSIHHLGANIYTSWEEKVRSALTIGIVGMSARVRASRTWHACMTTHLACVQVASGLSESTWFVWYFVSLVQWLYDCRIGSVVGMRCTPSRGP